MPTPVAKAKAEPECPAGNEKLPGMLTGSGRSFLRLAGRSRRARYFNGRFTSVDGIAIDTLPRRAARRPARPPSIAITPAIPTQSIDRLALLLSCLRERSASCRSFRVRRSNSRRSAASSLANQSSLPRLWGRAGRGLNLAANPSSAVGPLHPAAPAGSRHDASWWLVKLGNLACIDRPDRCAGREKLANRKELVSALLELRDEQPQRQTGRRRVGSTVKMHDHDRSGFDFRQHRRGDLLRVGVKGVDRVDGPLHRNESRDMDQIQRRPVVAAAGKPEVP